MIGNLSTLYISKNYLGNLPVICKSFTSFQFINICLIAEAYSIESNTDMNGASKIFLDWPDIHNYQRFEVNQGCIVCQVWYFHLIVRFLQAHHFRSNWGRRGRPAVIATALIRLTVASPIVSCVICGFLLGMATHPSTIWHWSELNIQVRIAVDTNRTIFLIQGWAGLWGFLRWLSLYCHT